VGLTCEVIPSLVDETPVCHESPVQHVTRLAEKKAEEVAVRMSPRWVIAADTAVVLGQEILGKPEDVEDARAMLRRLSGKEHSVLTGFCILRHPTGEKHVEAVESKVRFKNLAASEIDWYVKTGEPFDKAGAYAVQGRGAFMIKAICGSYTNVVGLPLCEVIEALGRLGVVELPEGP
jgi:septum formation protein